MNDQQDLEQQAELFAEIDIGRQQIERGECVHIETEDEVREFFKKLKQRKQLAQNQQDEAIPG